MDSTTSHRTLQKGDMLNWYRVERILGQGGFGVIYLATDTNLDFLVAIKEYIPNDIAKRTHDSHVHPITEEHDGMYQWGLDRFLKEARNLVKFKHPNIVRVMSVFQENNTAYMVMEFEEGEELRTYLKKPGVVTEKRLKELIVPISQGLTEVHRHGFIHRDIKPANILVRRDGTPVLLDFGSARNASRVTKHALTALVSVGYAPMEQYNGDEDASDQQGPWTDIYALGGVLYYAISGNDPMDCTRRGAALFNGGKDPLILAAYLGEGKFSEQFLRAVDWAMQFKVADRPQTIADWIPAVLDTGPMRGAESATQETIRRQGLLAGEEDSAIQTDLANDLADATVLARGRQSVPDAQLKQKTQKYKLGNTLAMVGGGTVAVALIASAGIWYANQSGNDVPSLDSGIDSANSTEPTAPVVVANVDATAADTAAKAETDRIIAQDLENAVAKAEADRIAAASAVKIEADRVAAENAAKLKAEQLAAETAAKLDADRQAAAKAAKIEADRVAAANAVKLKAEQLAAETAAKLDADRQAAAKAAKIEADRVAAANAAKLKAEQLAAERAAKLDADRQAAAKAAKIEADRVVAENAAKFKAEQLAAERAEKLAADRQAAAKAAKIEADRVAAENAAKLKAEQLAAETAAKLDADQQAAAKIEADRVTALRTIEDANQRRRGLNTALAEAEEALNFGNINLAKEKMVLAQSFGITDRRIDDLSTAMEGIVKDQQISVSDSDFYKVQRMFDGLKRSIEAKDTKTMDRISIASDQNQLFKQLMASFDKLSIEIKDVLVRNADKSIVATLRIKSMVRKNGDQATPSDAYRDRQITSRRINGRWSRISW